MVKSADWRLVAAIGVSILAHVIVFSLIYALLKQGGAETFGRQRHMSAFSNLASPNQNNSGRMQVRLVRPDQAIHPALSPSAAQRPITPVASAIVVASQPYHVPGEKPALELAAPSNHAENSGQVQIKKETSGGVAEKETSQIPLDAPGKEVQVAANPQRRSAFAFNPPRVVVGGPNEGLVRAPRDFQPEIHYRQMLEAQMKQRQQQQVQQLTAQLYRFLDERIGENADIPDGRCQLVMDTASQVGGSMECVPADLKAALGEQERQIVGLFMAVRAMGANTNGFSVAKQGGQRGISLLNGGQ